MAALGRLSSTTQVALALIAVSAFAIPLSQAQSPSGYSGPGRYQIENVASGKVLDADIRDGRTLRQHVEHATGTAERPMTDREIETKFRGLCEPYLPASQITSLIDRCWNITDVPDAATFAQLARVN